jgi:hypothetical protein
VVVFEVGWEVPCEQAVAARIVRTKRVERRSAETLAGEVGVER